MSAILHSIVAGIEYDRIKNNILMWKYNALEASMWKRVNEERAYDERMSSFPYRSVQQNITWYGEDIKDYFNMCCDDCGKKFHTNKHSNRLYRSTTVMCLGQEWEGYDLCDGCKKNYVIHECGCGDFVKDEDWDCDEDVCIHCADEDDLFGCSSSEESD